jgi:hypothetical protein
MPLNERETDFPADDKGCDKLPAFIISRTVNSRCGLIALTLNHLTFSDIL